MLTDIKEVIEKLNEELLEAPLDFIGMEKGTLSYKGGVERKRCILHHI